MWFSFSLKALKIKKKLNLTKQTIIYYNLSFIETAKVLKIVVYAHQTNFTCRQ